MPDRATCPGAAGIDRVMMEESARLLPADRLLTGGDESVEQGAGPEWPRSTGLPVHLMRVLGITVRTAMRYVAIAPRTGQSVLPQSQMPHRSAALG